MKQVNKIKIKSFNYYRVPAGWRNWLILCVESSDGIFGYSEFTDSNGSEATLLIAVNEIGHLLASRNVDSVEDVVIALRKKYRQSLPGIMFKAISAFENALWDLKSKNSGRPILTLLGGRIRKQDIEYFKCYWSHCPTTRIRASRHIGMKPILNYSDLSVLGKEISFLEFSAFKTNLVQISPSLDVLMPGFNKNLVLTHENIPNNYPDELQKILQLILNQSDSLEAIVDLNFNADLNSFKAIQKSLTGLKIRWLEIDFDDIQTYKDILNSKEFPICTGENILGLYNFEKVLNDSRVDIISIDILWNGLSESLKIAEVAISCGKKIAVHNYYGSLATSIALEFLSMLPKDSIELLEFDFDDVPWRDTIVTNPPRLIKGSLEFKAGIGWNNEVVLSNLNF